MPCSAASREMETTLNFLACRSVIPQKCLSPCPDPCVPFRGRARIRQLKTRDNGGFGN